MHTGRWPKPLSLVVGELACWRPACTRRARRRRSLVATVSIFSLSDGARPGRGSGSRSARRTPRPRPGPGRSRPRRRRRSACTPRPARPSPRRSRRIASCSRGVVGREAVDRDDRRDAVGLDVLDLLAQVGRAGVRRRRGSRASRSAGSGLPATILYLPECALSARTVATSTAASGTSPEARHLMLKNRSAPMSAPKPASVMR